MIKLKKTTIIILTIGIVFSLIPAIIFLCNFNSSSISNDSSLWGSFGDFIGGTIGSIIGIINLALLVAISFYVAQLDSHKQFNEYRYKVYLDLWDKFNNVNDSADDYENLNIYILSFGSKNRFLFPKKSGELFINIIKRLSSSLTALIESKDLIEEQITNNQRAVITLSGATSRKLGKLLEDISDNNAEKSPEEIIEENFQKIRNELLDFIQDVMTEGDIKKYNTSLIQKQG